MTCAYLGIDTSNYTTSLAICDAKGKLLQDERQVLKVKQGERGLRQSEAVFQHITVLPELIEKIITDDIKLCGIGCSVQPRPVKDSYMPVFKAGECIARSLSKMLQVPFLRFSHQENHIRSALYGCALSPEEMHFPFLATHFSGGTSELLTVQLSENGFNCQIAGKTLDLNAGQLIDRIGVKMGLPFPAGKKLEELALQASFSGVRINSRVERCNFHFSGQENQCLALMEKGIPHADIAAALFRSIAKTLEKSVRSACRHYHIYDVVFAGGVMANGLIQSTLQQRFNGSGIQLYFTDPAFATDNAVGTALLTRDKLIQDGGIA